MKKHLKICLILFLCLLISSIGIKSLEKQTIITEINQNTYAKNTEKTTKSIKNIVVFIRFNDSDTNVINHLDDEQSVLNAYKLFNSDNLIDMDTTSGMVKVPSFKKYYERESYGQLSITSEIFPKQNDKVVSFTSPHPIGYFLRYDENNKIGYKDKTESLVRETELVNSAISYIENMVLSSGITRDELDSNHDGKMDALTFIIEGQKNLPTPIQFNDLLWSHKLDNTGVTNQILGKSATAYTLLYADDYTESAALFSLNRGTYGTIIHEYGHMLGFMDLYRYGNSSSKPVGFYDIMGNTIGSNPQGFLTYFISEYHPNTNWHYPLPLIEETTKDITLTKPKYLDKDEKRAIKIEVSGNKDEYFIVEYHEKLNTYSSYSADKSGIIIYRVNEKNKYLGNGSGSNQGKSDHIYIFRPNETGLGNGEGNLSQATLNTTRPKYGKDLVLGNKDFDNEAIFFSDGSNSGLKIEVTNETADSITFNVYFPKLEGEGTKDKPYLIRDVETYLYLMGTKTTNKYYKLMNDLDFTNIVYPSIDFEGNLDGNNKTIRNINSKNTGVFNFLGNNLSLTKLKNLKIENIIVNANSENYLGGFANVAENTSLYNIQIINGEITHEGAKVNDIASTGGLIGNVDNQTIIDNCFVNAQITSPKNVGGLIGLNKNAIIKNSFVQGSVNGNKNAGAFIGVQAITDKIYNIPENVYFDSDVFRIAVGGYASYNMHDLNVLDASSLDKGIRSITINNSLSVTQFKTLEIPIVIEPNANLTYQVTIENPHIATYQNNKIEGLQIGKTHTYIDFNIGINKMRFISTLTIEAPVGTITEKEVLEFLGISKNQEYVVGFALNTNISSIQKKILTDSRIELKQFLNNKGEKIKEGLVATGMRFTLIFNQKEYTYTIVIKGDVNGDGYIYATDYVKVRNHIMGKSKLTGPYLLAADINNDKNIYATDYVQIRNHIMGKTQIVQK